MSYPPWLPWPRYILKSLLLLLGAALAIAIGQAPIALTAIPLIVGGGLGLVDAIATIWVLIWVILVPIWIFAQCDRLVWHKPKASKKWWIPSNRNLAEGTFAYCALVLALIITAITVPTPSRYLTNEQAGAIALLIVIITAYIYHLGGYLWRWQQTTFKPKPKRKPARRQPTSKARPVLSKPMTDIDRELERMKREMREK